MTPLGPPERLGEAQINGKVKFAIHPSLELVLGAVVRMISLVRNLAALCRKMRCANGARAFLGPTGAQGEGSDLRCLWMRQRRQNYHNSGSLRRLSPLPAEGVNGGCVPAPQDPEQAPTFGMTPYRHKEGSYTIKMLDLGGGKKFRGFWKSNYPEVPTAYPAAG